MSNPETGEQEATSEIVALLRGESDFRLLEFMAKRNQDEVWAEAAFNEFYPRHAAYLWEVCRNVAERLNGDAWVQDILEETFELAYEKADRFKSPVASPTPEDERRIVRAWLGTIATNRLRSILRKYRQQYTQDETTWEKLANSAAGLDGEHDGESRILRERVLIREALETLSEREQHVIRVTFQFYRVGQKFQRLPNDVAQDLAESLGTTPENLRKIRERALRKIREYVDEHYNDQSSQIINQ